VTPVSSATNAHRPDGRDDGVVTVAPVLERVGPFCRLAGLFIWVASSGDQGLVICLSQSKEGWHYAHRII
jgi:hypothetical protein